MTELKEAVEKLALKFAELPVDEKKGYLRKNPILLSQSGLVDNILLNACSIVTIHELSEAGRINLSRKILVDAKRLGIDQAFDEHEKLVQHYTELIDQFFATKSIFKKKEILLDEPKLLTLIGLYFLSEKSNQVYAKALAEIKMGSQEFQEYQAYRVLFIRCIEFGIDFAFDDFQKRMNEHHDSNIFDEIVKDNETSRSISKYTKKS